MTREELEVMLNGVDEEEKNLMLAADDAYDRLYAYQLHKKYGVEVKCNPDGDRTKISIDGEIMNQEEFAAWLSAKEAAECGDVLPEDELPEEIIIPYSDLNTRDERGVKEYLRRITGHYLAKGVEPNMEWLDDEVEVTGIEYGRKI